MSSLVDELGRLRATPNALLDRIPYARFLGLSVKTDDDGVLATMAYSERLVGNPALPALHGGSIGSLLESAAIFQVIWGSETVVVPKTITLTIDYLRSAGPKDTFARGTIVRSGRRVTNVRCVAWQDDPEKPVAVAHCHLLIRGDAG